MYHWKAFFLISAMQNIASELIITVKNYFNITSFKMKGSPDLGQADERLHMKLECSRIAFLFIVLTCPNKL